MLDPRLGYRNSYGEIKYLPSQYADGTPFNYGDLAISTIYYLNCDYFVALPVGITSLGEISGTLESELLALIGIVSAIGDVNSIMHLLGIQPIGSFGIFDDFIGVNLSNETWLTDTSGGSVTQPNLGYTVVQLNTDNVANNHATMTSIQAFISSPKMIYLEARIRVNQIADCHIEFGFSDTHSNADGTLVSSVSPVVTNTQNAVTFAYHNSPTEPSDRWYACSIKDGFPRSIGLFQNNPIVPIPNEYVNLSIAIAINGDKTDASFFVNNLVVATFQDSIGIELPTYVWLSAKTLNGDPVMLDADYIRITQMR